MQWVSIIPSQRLLAPPPSKPKSNRAKAEQATAAGLLALSTGSTVVEEPPPPPPPPESGPLQPWALPPPKRGRPRKDQVWQINGVWKQPQADGEKRPKGRAPNDKSGQPKRWNPVSSRWESQEEVAAAAAAASAATASSATPTAASTFSHPVSYTMPPQPMSVPPIIANYAAMPMLAAAPPMPAAPLAPAPLPAEVMALPATAVVPAAPEALELPAAPVATVATPTVATAGEKRPRDEVQEVDDESNAAQRVCSGATEQISEDDLSTIGSTVGLADGTIENFLAAYRLEAFGEAFERLGASVPADLRDVTEADLEAMQMPILSRRRFGRAMEELRPEA